jgi:hypothetical protein
MKTHAPLVRADCFTLLAVLALFLAHRAEAIDILVTTNSDSGNGTLRQAIWPPEL